MHRMRMLGAAALAVASPMAFASRAEAVVIDFDNLGNETQNKTFSTLVTQGFVFINSQGFSDSLLVWNRESPYNADPNGGTLTNNYATTVTTMTRQGGGSFNFDAIDVADGFNNGQDTLQKSIRFTFTTASGSTQQTFNFDTLPGFQTFNLGQTNLISASWQIVNSTRNYGQVDNIRLDGDVAAVPEPASWAMMIAGFGLIGGRMRSRRIRPVAMQFAG